MLPCQTEIACCIIPRNKNRCYKRCLGTLVVLVAIYTHT